MASEAIERFEADRRRQERARLERDVLLTLDDLERHDDVTEDQRVLIGRARRATERLLDVC